MIYPKISNARNKDIDSMDIVAEVRYVVAVDSIMRTVAEITQ